MSAILECGAGHVFPSYQGPACPVCGTLPLQSVMAGGFRVWSCWLCGESGTGELPATHRSGECDWSEISRRNFETWSRARFPEGQ